MFQIFIFGIIVVTLSQLADYCSFRTVLSHSFRVRVKRIALFCCESHCLWFAPTGTGSKFSLIHHRCISCLCCHRFFTRFRFCRPDGKESERHSFHQLRLGQWSLDTRRAQGESHQPRSVAHCLLPQEFSVNLCNKRLMFCRSSTQKTSPLTP